MRIFRDPDEILPKIIRGGINEVIGLRNGTVSFILQNIFPSFNFSFPGPKTSSPML